MNTGRIQQDAVRSVWASVWMLAGLALAAWLGWLVFPDSAPVTEMARKAFISVFESALRPELREALTFYSTMALAPLIAWGAVRLAERSGERGRGGWKMVIIFLSALFVWMLAGNRVDCYWILPLRLRRQWLWPGSGIVLFGILWCWVRKGEWHRLRSVEWPFCIVLIMFGVLSGKIYPYNMVSSLFTYHFEPICYAVSQSVGEYGLYGWYGQMLQPLFSWSGTGVHTISLVFGGLTLIMMIGWGYSLKRVVRFPLVLLLFICGVVYLSCMQSILMGAGLDPYYEYHPLRSLFPCLFMVWVTSHFVDEWRYWAVGGVLGGMALLWNFDSGVAVAGSCGCLAGLRLLTMFSRKNMISVAIFTGVLLAVGGGGWLWFSGGWLSAEANIRILLENQKNFSQYGFNLLPMPPIPAMWGAVAAVYAIGLAAAFGVLRQNPMTWFRMVYWRSLTGCVFLGCGLLLYYQGRSHINNLAAVAFPAFWVVSVWCDRLIALMRRQKLSRWFAAPVAVWGWCGALLLLALVLNGEVALKRARYIFQSYQERPDPVLVDNAAFIAECAQGRQVHIWGSWQGLLFAQTQLRSATPRGCLVEVFRRDDQVRIWQSFREHPAPLFITRAFPLSEQVPREILRGKYRLRMISPNRMVAFFEPLAETAMQR